MKIEAISDCRTILGEGLLWDVAEQKLCWVDTYGRMIYRADQDGRRMERWPVSDVIGSMALRAGGGAILALATGLHEFDFGTGDARPLLDLHVGPGIRLNDGKVDRSGRFLFGSMDMTETTPAGAVYSLDVDLTVEQVDASVTVFNGTCWSPDGTVLYFADSRSRSIWTVDYDLGSGRIGNKRRFASFPPDNGFPDGATVDEEGFIWSAGVYGGKVLRFAPDGRLDRCIDMPVRCVTSVMFGGVDLATLYATSMARPPVPDGPQDGPLGGSVFALRDLGVRGLPERRFGG